MILIGKQTPIYFIVLHQLWFSSIKSELLMQGRHVMMGYLGSPEKTTDALTQSGWLRSGDLGTYDSDDFFKITGRAKEIIITAGGENVAPIPIEDLIKKQLPCVANAMIVGDRKKFLSCFLTLKTDVDPVTLEPQNQLSLLSLEWCQSIGSKAEVINQD